MLDGGSLSCYKDEKHAKQVSVVSLCLSVCLSVSVSLSLTLSHSWSDCNSKNITLSVFLGFNRNYGNIHFLSCSI